jgi:hypothetical protein
MPPLCPPPRRLPPNRPTVASPRSPHNPTVHPLSAPTAGDESIQPYAILVLFLSLAYMAAALDQTGAFNWLALKMTRAASTGRRLFVLHSLLAGAVTLGTRSVLTRGRCRGRTGAEAGSVLMPGGGEGGGRAA